jgi:hypothetical protein
MFIALYLAVLTGCGGGGGLKLSSIQGPSTINEGGSALYSITASGDTNIHYLWACEPATAGTFSYPQSATTAFATQDVELNTVITIRVTVDGDKSDPQVVSIQVTITDQLVTGWVQAFGGNNFDAGKTIVCDSQDNVYVAGIFSGTVDFDPGEGFAERTSKGFTDVFISLFDDGGKFTGVRVFGGTDWDDCSSIFVDTDDNFYIAGSFKGIADFDTGVGVEEHMSRGESDIYVMKLDSDGKLLWVNTWGGAKADRSGDLAMDSSGGVFVTGSFKDSVDFDPASGGYNLISSGEQDAFLSKFDSSGQFKWARAWGGTSDDEGLSLAINSLGSIFVAGYFSDTVDLDPGGDMKIVASNGGNDAYLSSFNTSGNFLWTGTWGASGDDQSLGISIDGFDNIYVAGKFSETVDFNPGTALEEHSSNGMADAFLSKFSSDGIFTGARTWGGAGIDEASCIVVDNMGYACVGGDYEGTVDFNPGNDIDNHFSNGNDDFFVSRFNPTGTFLWARTMGGTNFDFCTAIASDSTHSAILTGYFIGSVDFDPGDGTNIHESNTGTNDIFVLKLSPTGALVN